MRKEDKIVLCTDKEQKSRVESPLLHTYTQFYRTLISGDLGNLHLTLLLGCTLQACKPCSCPALRPKSLKTATETSVGYSTGDSQHRVLEWPLTLCSRRWIGHSSSLCWERRRLSFIGNWCQVGSSVTGKPLEGHAPHHPFDKLGPGASMQEGQSCT